MTDKPQPEPARTDEPPELSVVVPLEELLAGPDEQRLAPHERDWPRPWMRAFLGALIVVPEVLAACDAARVSKSTAYAYRASMPEFKEAWEDAMNAQRRTFLHNVHRWVTTGLPYEEVVEELDAAGVVVKRKVTRRAIRSERLAELWLRAWFPDRFRLPDRAAQEGGDGSPVEVVATREEIDAAVDGFSAVVVRLADARRAKASAQSGQPGK